jgi:hypothetical protein
LARGSNGEIILPQREGKRWTYLREIIVSFLVLFQFLTYANKHITVFWDAVSCTIVEIDRRFRCTA